MISQQTEDVYTMLSKNNYCALFNTQLCRRWSNINPASVQCLVFAGMSYEIAVEKYIWVLILKALKYFCINPRDRRFLILKSSFINVLVSSFCFIWTHKLWVYDHYKYLYSYSAGIDCMDVYSRQILTSKVDPSAVRVRLFAKQENDNEFW